VVTSGFSRLADGSLAVIRTEKEGGK
jgi:hypothetical protein